MAKSKWPIVKEAIEDGSIERWLSNGVLEKTIAKNLGIHISTWEKYKSQSTELKEAIKKGNRKIINEVQDALIKRALGYDYTESTITQNKMPDGTIKETKQVHKRHQAPDTGAAIFILKNKDKENWVNEPAIIELRKMELELRKQIAEGEGKIWDNE